MKQLVKINNNLLDVNDAILITYSEKTEIVRVMFSNEVCIELRASAEEYAALQEEIMQFSKSKNA